MRQRLAILYSAHLCRGQRALPNAHGVWHSNPNPIQIQSKSAFFGRTACCGPAGSGQCGTAEHCSTAYCRTSTHVSRGDTLQNIVDITVAPTIPCATVHRAVHRGTVQYRDCLRSRSSALRPNRTVQCECSLRTPSAQPYSVSTHCALVAVAGFTGEVP